jgi:hypothetical protein
LTSVLRWSWRGSDGREEDVSSRQGRSWSHVVAGCIGGAAWLTAAAALAGEPGGARQALLADPCTAFLDVGSNCCEATGIAAAGIMTGCGSAYFCPSEHLMREDMGVILEKAYRGAAWAPAPLTAGPGPFSDVPWTYGFAPWIKALYDDQIAQGFTDGTFRSSTFVSRGNMAIFIANTIVKRWPGSYPGGVPTSGVARGVEWSCIDSNKSLFSDVTKDTQGCAHIHFLYGLCVANGYTSTTFGPSIMLSRLQMSMFLWRAFVARGTNPPSCNTTPPNSVPVCTF